MAHYAYNGRGRLVEVDYTQPTVKLRRDDDANGSYEALDQFGRIKTQTWKHSGGALMDHVSYQYDYASNRTARDIASTLYGTNDLDQVYNYADRKRWNAGSPRPKNMLRQATLGLVRSSPQHVLGERDRVRGLSEIDLKCATRHHRRCASASRLFDRPVYGYDSLHRLKNFDEGSMSGSSIASPTKEQDWTLDTLGNWNNLTEKTGGSTTLNQNRGHNNANELTTIAGASTYVGHDAAGNMTKVPKPTSWSSAYDLEFDAWNRLIRVKDGGTTVASYSYDGLHRRIVKTVGATTEQHYYNEQWQLLEVRIGTEASAARQKYVWHPYYIDALAQRFWDGNSDGDFLDANEKHFVMHDGNFNVTSVMTTGGTVFERYYYSPYGKLTVLDSNFAVDSDGLSDVANPYTYTGRQYDAESGIYQYRHRYYHAQLGRFVGRDPVGPSASYSYVGNRAPNLIDPSGLRECRPTPASGVQTIVLGQINAELKYHPTSHQLAFSFHADASFNKQDFTDSNGCCCCDQVAWVQVLQSEVIRYDNNVWIHTGGSVPRVDGGFPYVYSQRKGPCAGSTTTVSMDDTPGAGWYLNRLSYRMLTDFNMYFETCLVCTSGIEGPRWKTQAQLGQSISRLEGATVYGCVRWGWSLSGSKGSYTGSMFIDDQYSPLSVARPEKDLTDAELWALPSVFRPLAPGSPPSMMFSDTLRSYLKFTTYPVLPVF